MATVICMDGLGGHPKVTFRSLKVVLELAGHRVVYADIQGIRTHEDRVQRVIKTYRTEQDSTAEKIFLLGQSAGGSAVRIATSRLKGEKRLGGVILLSQAMPRFVWFMTPELWQNMRGRICELLFGQDIRTTEREYERFIQPIPPCKKLRAMAGRQTFPGLETRTLAFWPPLLSGCEYPMLYVWGAKDQWISAKAHRKLGTLLKGMCSSLVTMEIPGVGHLTLASERKEEVIETIKEWIRERL